MVLLAGTAQHVLGTLGSLRQTAAGVQNTSPINTGSLFGLDASSQGGSATGATGSTGATGAWWSSPGTMNALLSSQDPSGGGAAGAAGSTNSAQGHHGGHHHHSHVGSTQDGNQTALGSGTAADGTTSSLSLSSTGSGAGAGGILSQLFSQQTLLASAPTGQSLAITA